jgi:hypothetical protein
MKNKPTKEKGDPPIRYEKGDPPIRYESMSSHLPRRCGNCDMMIRPNSCELVKGMISPFGWCKRWIKKT